MLRSFFDYPDESGVAPALEIVLLSHWDDAQWARLLTYTQTRRFRAGDTVIRQGDTDRTLFIIVEGSLEVLIPRGTSGQLRQVQVYGAGSVIGEQAFLDGRPRSATLRALSDGSILGLSVEAYEVFAVREPELARDLIFDLARTLSARLRHTSELISNWMK